MQIAVLPLTLNRQCLALTRCLCRFPPSSAFLPAFPSALLRPARGCSRRCRPVPPAPASSLGRTFPARRRRGPAFPRSDCRPSRSSETSGPASIGCKGLSLCSRGASIGRAGGGAELTIKGGAGAARTGGTDGLRPRRRGRPERAGAGEERRPHTDAPRLPGSRAQPAAPAVAPGPRRAARAARSVSPPVCPSAEMSEVSGPAPGTPGGRREVLRVWGVGRARRPGRGDAPAPGSAEGLEGREALSPRAGPPRLCPDAAGRPVTALTPASARLSPETAGVRSPSAELPAALLTSWVLCEAPRRPSSQTSPRQVSSPAEHGSARRRAMRRREPLRPESRASLLPPGSGLAGAPSWGLQPFPARGLLQPAPSPHTHQLWP